MVFGKGKSAALKKAKRVLSAFLAALLVFGVIPTSAFAAPAAGGSNMKAVANVDGVEQEVPALFKTDTNDQSSFYVTMYNQLDSGATWAGWGANQIVASVQMNSGGAGVQTILAISAPTADNSSELKFTLTGGATTTNLTADNIVVYGGVYRSTYSVTVEGQTGQTGITYGSPYTLPDSDAADVEAGKVLIGWTETHTGMVYAPGAEVTVTQKMNFAPLVGVVEEVTKHIVTFQDGIGNVISSSLVQDGKDAQAPADPVREGYTFAGWSGTYTGVTANTVVTATWTAQQYAITTSGNVTLSGATTAETGAEVMLSIIPNSGDAVTSVVGKYSVGGGAEKMIPLLQTGEKDTYLFTMPAANVEIIANTEKIPTYYTVRFEMPEGTQVAESQVEAGEVIIAPANPQKEGHTFVGWVKKGSDEAFAVGTVAEADVTYVAVFKANAPVMHTITVETTPGIGGAQVTTQQAVAGEEKTIKVTPVVGYTYVVTVEDANGYPVDIAKTENEDEYKFRMPDSNVTVRVSYSAVPVKPQSDITVNATHVNVAVKDGLSDKAAGDIVTFTVTAEGGYKLSYVRVITAGDEIVTNIITNGYAFVMPEENVTIEAVATEVKEIYTINFKLDDGTMYDYQKVEEGQTIVTPEAPVKAGHTFDGWYSQKNGSGTKLTVDAKAEGNTTWYANFIAEEVSVTYVDEKHTTVPEGETVTYGTKYTVKAPVNQNDTKFIGWAASDGQIMLPNEAYTITDSLTLTAVYETVDPIYVVTFKDMNGVVLHTALAQLENNYTVTTPDFSAEEGYDTANAKWANGSTVLNAGDFVQVDTDKVFTIVGYTANAYAIHKEVTIDNDALKDTSVIVHTNADYKDTVEFTVQEHNGYVPVNVWVSTVQAGIPVAQKSASDRATTYTFTMPAAEVTIHVVYEKIPAKEYIVKFMANDSLYDWRFTEEGAVIQAPVVTPVKKGAEFVEWNTQKDGNGDKLNTDSSATQNVTYYAIFENVDYDITVTTNPTSLGGAAVNTITGVYGEIKTLTVEDKTGEGYYLDSIIITDAEGNGVPYAPVIVGSAYTFVMPASSVTVTVNYAKIPAGSAVVKFMTDGRLFDYQVVTKGESGVTPAAPEKEGFTFTGWQTKNGALIPAESVYTVSAEAEDEIVYRAQWTENQKEFVISTRGEHVVITAPTKGTVGENITFKAKAEDGYDLSYVKVFKTDGGELVTGVTGTGTGEYTFVMPRADVTIEAVVTEHIDIYTIDFKLDDGTMYDQQRLVEGTSITVPGQPTKEGHTFLYWADENGGQIDVANTTATRNMTLTAVFEANDLTVTYVDEKDDTTPRSVTVKYGVPYEVEAPKDDTKFIAWAASDGQILLPGNEYVFTKEVTTLKAIYETVDPIYVVSFKGIDGMIYHTALAQLDNHYSVTTPAYPAVEGYEVHEPGWKNVDGTESKAAGTVIENVAKDMTFVLDAEAIVYPITINVTPAEVGNEQVSATAGTYGETVVVTANIPDGYFLKGINAVTDSGKGIALAPTDTEGVYTFTMPAEKVAINVTYEEIPAGYSFVKFVSENNLIDSQVIEKGTTGTTPSAPVRNGYEFTGWSRDNGATKIGAEHQYEVALGDADEIIYVAQWTANAYTVTYDAAGGTPTPMAQTAGYGKQVTLADGPAKADETFVGWQDALTGMVYAAGVKYTVTANTTMKAVYTVNEYVVKFVDPITGILYGYQGVTAGVTVTAPIAPERVGYTFVEWAEADNAVNPDRVKAAGTTAPITKDTTYEAVWSVKEYTVTGTGTNAVVTPGTQKVQYAEDVRFTVTPAEDCGIETVYISYMEGGIPFTTVLNPMEVHKDGSAEYGFVMPGADVEITAIAKQTIFSVEVEENTIIHISCAVDKAKAGADVWFTAESVNADYSVDNVYVETASGVKVPVSVVLGTNGKAEYHFTMPAEDVRIYAQETQKAYTVYYLDSDNTLLDMVSVASGDTTTAPVLEAEEGYHFVGWKWLKTNKPNIAPGEEFRVREDRYLQAIYEGDEHTVQAGVTENIYILKADQGKDMSNSVDLLNNRANKLTSKTGETVYFQVAADYNWMISDITITSVNGNSDLVVQPILIAKSEVTGAPIGQEDQNGSDLYTYAFTMPAEDVAINIYTKAREYNVKVVENLPECGEYTINGYRTTNHDVPQGATVEIAVTPEKGYRVANVVGKYTNKAGLETTVLGEWVEETGVYSFPMVPFDVTVTITYEAIPYTVNVTNSNGTSENPGTYNPQAGGPFGTAKETYDVDNKGYVVLLNEDDTPVVGVDNTDIGYIYPLNSQYIVGDTVRFTVETYRGWVFDNVQVTYDGATKTIPVTEKDDVYYFTMPAAEDVVITAEYVKDTYTITKKVEGEDHGDIVMNGLQENKITAEYKSDVKVTVTPDTGYYVESISYQLDGKSVSGDHAISNDTKADTASDFSNKASYTGKLLTDTHDTVHELDIIVPSTDVTIMVKYAKIDYTIQSVVNGVVSTETVNDQEGGKITLSTVKTTVGEQVTITSEPKHGYRMVNLVVTNRRTGEVVTAYLKGTEPEKDISTYYFNMPADPVEVTAVFEKIKFVVTYLNSDNAVVGFENVTYLNTAHVGEFAEKVVSAPNGEHFIGWVSDDVQTPVTTPSVEDADFVVVKDTIIKAVFANDVTNVVFNSTVNGVVASEGKSTPDTFTVVKKYRDKVEFTATPDEGYEIDKVTVTTLDENGDPLYVNYSTELTGKVGTYNFVIPATYKEDVHAAQSADIVVNVTFKTTTYTLTEAEDSGVNGTVSVNGLISTQKTFNYQYQDDVTIVVTPDAGYYVESIVVTADDDGEELFTTGIQAKPAMDTSAGEPLTLSFKMPAEDVTYKVTYQKMDYSITRVFNAEHGIVTSVDSAQLGDVVDVVVTPKRGYALKSLTATYADGRKSLVLTEVKENQFTFTMPADAVTITAEFVQVTYNVTMTQTGKGVVRLNGHDSTDITADYLEVITIDATPEKGWELVSITVDGGNVEVTPEIDAKGGQYSFVMPNYDVEVSVVFERYTSDVNVFEVNAYQEGHGKVTISETGKVGDKMTFVANPDNGYRVKRVSVIDAEGNSVPVSFVSEDKYYVEKWSFTMPASAVDVRVVFEAYAASYYVDSRTDDWYYEAVEYVTDRGYFTGMTDHIFGPNILMTREMFVTVLARMEGIDVSKYYGQETGFVDASIAGWYAPYVAWGLESGVTTGYTDGSNRFGVGDPITREQMFTMMYRYAKYKGVDTKVAYPQFMDRYEDKDQISPYAYEALVWCVSEGVAKGMSDTTINPLEYAPRAHAAQMFKNYCDNVWFR